MTLRWTSFLTALAAVSLTGCAAGPMTFDRPELALNALESAVDAHSIEQTNAIFGPEGDYLLYTGDPTLDKQRAQKFVQLFKEKHELQKNEDGTYTVVIGKKSWPFPVPLVGDGERWHFDAEAGREEILARRVGSNELFTMDVARSVALAQRIYAAGRHGENGERQYASRLISTPGKKDGLYWPVEEGETPSPLGPVAVQAADEDYVITEGGEPQPYHGYFYKLFTSPPDPSAADVLSRPGKYWLISYPAEWGASGIMTFATNERGWIYQKNFGADRSFDDRSDVVVDESWKRIE